MPLTRLIKSLIIIAFCLEPFTAYSQTGETVKHNRIILSPGISIQKNVFAELNFAMINLETTKGGQCISGFAAGPRIGCDFNFTPGNGVIAPKIGYEFAGSLFCYRASAVYYMSHKVNDLRLLPEAGFSYLSWINLTYGHGFSVLRENNNRIGRSVWRLDFNLSRLLWRDH